MLPRTRPFRIASVLLALPVLLSTGCAHTQRAHPEMEPPPSCVTGFAALCLSEGGAALVRGDRALAEEDYAKACEAAYGDACLRLGRLELEDGNLEGAEPALREALTSETKAAYEALADLEEARGRRDVAANLREQSLAVEHPDAEVTGWYRVGLGGGRVGSGGAVALNVQPMPFLSRRLCIGFEAAFGPGPNELMGYVGYQRFVTDFFIPYANVQAGALIGAGAETRFDMGAEMGIKLALGPVGHLNAAVGASDGSPLHFSIGLGLNYLLALVAVLH